MKIGRMFIAAAVCAVALAGWTDADAQAAFPASGNPGIVLAGSQDVTKLPDQARKFILKHFKGETVTKCEEYYAKGTYEVELSNGMDIEFDGKGKVTEADARDNECMPLSVVKDLVHRKAFDRLEKDGYAAKVESIEFDKRGHAVEVEVSASDPDVYVFDVNGDFIALTD